MRHPTMGQSQIGGDMLSLDHAPHRQVGHRGSVHLRFVPKSCRIH